LFKSQISNFSAISSREQVTFYEKMMMMSTWYWTNTLSWIFIAPAHRNEQSVGTNVDPLRHIILISTQSIFALIL